MSHGKTLQGLLDKAEIADLIHAYCFHFDRGEAADVVALFTDDAIVDYGPDVPAMTGRSELFAMVSKGLSDFFEATSHHVSNIVISFESEKSAKSNCYLYAWHRYLETGEESEIWAQYRHEFRHTESGWRISRLVLHAAGTRDFHRQNMHPIGELRAAKSRSSR